VRDHGGLRGRIQARAQIARPRRVGGSRGQPDPPYFRFIAEQARPIGPLVAPHPIVTQPFGEDGLAGRAGDAILAPIGLADEPVLLDAVAEHFAESPDGRRYVVRADVELGAERGRTVPFAVVGEACEGVEQRLHALIVLLRPSGSLPLRHSGRPERRGRSRQLGAAHRPTSCPAAAGAAIRRYARR
jgi:hypothetical protein